MRPVPVGTSTQLPSEHEEFSLTDKGLVATDSEAANRVDLLTVVLHELGHVLGFGDDPSDELPTLMQAQLGLGTRRLPPEFLDAVFQEGVLWAPPNQQ